MAESRETGKMGDVLSAGRGEMRREEEEVVGRERGWGGGWAGGRMRR